MHIHYNTNQTTLPLEISSFLPQDHLVFFFLLKKRSFYYPKFIKFFWRTGFLLTLIMYIEMVVELFLMK
ncbi:integral membrane protein [Streptococcus pneumoniae]|nr:integral membrane protein [Streptococcus pneumoniae]